MRVLHVITGLGVGGAEHQLRLLVRHLPDDCEVVTLTNPGPVAAAIAAGGTPVHHLGMRGNRDVAALGKLTRFIRAGRFDLVHTHLYRACVYGRIAARLAGVPHVVATEHSLGDGVIENRAVTRAVQALYLTTERLGDVTIAVSQTVADRLAGWRVPASRVAVVPNGIDPAEFRFDPTVRAATRARLGLPADARVVGAVGRLTATKRFDVLIDAVAMLEGVHLLLVGDGPERAPLARRATARGVAQRVWFAGAVDHARDGLAAMDVFAAPSEQETFGMAVLEALACGLPALYVRCPAVSELPPDAAPYAQQLPAEPAAFAAALRTECAAVAQRTECAAVAQRTECAAVAQRTECAAVAQRTARHPPPAAVAHYDMARVSDAVAQCYERVSTRRRRSHALFPYRTTANEGS